MPDYKQKLGLMPPNAPGLAAHIREQAQDDKKVWLSPEACALLECVDDFETSDSRSLERLSHAGALGDIAVHCDALLPPYMARFTEGHPESEDARVLDIADFF